MSQFGFDGIQREVEESLTRHRINGSMEFPSSNDDDSLLGSYNLLCTLTNYHWGDFLTTDHRPRVTSAPKNRIECKRSYQLKFANEVTGGKLHFPTSIRNRVILFIVNGDALHLLQLLHFHFNGIIPYMSTNVEYVSDVDTSVVESKSVATRTVGHRDAPHTATISNMAVEQSVFAYFLDRVQFSCFFVAFSF